VKPREIVFTGGLTEANDLAILGRARRLEMEGVPLSSTHWVVSSIEHASVLECFGDIERRGGRVTFIDPDARGLFAPEAVARALRPETVLVSIGWANNELGTVQPLSDISHAIRAYEKSSGATIMFHSDAGQAPLYRPTTAHSLGVDLLSVGSNKLYGPHGIGALYINNRAELAPIILGGRQERWLRGGTENVELAAGFAAAYEASAKERGSEAKRLKELRDGFAKQLLSIPGLIVNGDLGHALPHMLNVSIPGIQSEYVTLALDARSIAVSTKSACREGEESESHAVAALYPEEEAWKARNTLRFSLGRETSKADLDMAAEALSAVIAQNSDEGKR
jgi:cysteine desulfurase